MMSVFTICCSGEGWNAMTSMSLFGDGAELGPKPLDRRSRRLKVLVTVKAAPTPSAQYGETVCVAGISVDLEQPGWIRLYPINFRELTDPASFAKYDIVEVDAVPSAGSQDQRVESWRPQAGTFSVVGKAAAGGRWVARRNWLDPLISVSMCELNAGVKGNPAGQSLGLVPVKELLKLELKPHPGWTEDEQDKINGYINQMPLLPDESGQEARLSPVARRPLEAPRMKGWYQWRCQTCRPGGSHRQGILDWEFVALQRSIGAVDDSELKKRIEAVYVDKLFAPDRETSFFVGNQSKRPQAFAVLGVFWPKR